MITQRVSDPNLAPALLELIREAFAEQTGRITPPSSMHKLTPEDIVAHMKENSIWAIFDGDLLVACVFGTHQDDNLYLSKLSVALAARKRGLARQMLTDIEEVARQNQIKCLTLISRIELIENHRFFEHLGFVKTGTGSHPGFTRPTEIHFAKVIEGT